jgi:exopolyphosphatase/guanosine-5'-triphosphate,3'-diphosphate pyrophosphatase
MRVATIDIGTNTILLLVAERDARGELVAVREEATITRLGQGVDKTKHLAPEAIVRATDCLGRYADIVKDLGVARVDVVGTSAMRDAGGSDEIRAFVRARLGVDARVISGEEEARVTFAGALSGLPKVDGPVVVFDIGGGSTEVVRGEGNRVHHATSVDMGSVRLTERCIHTDPPRAEDLAAARDACKRAFESLPDLPTSHAPVGIAGTMTTFAAISMRMATYDGARVHGSVLSRADLARITDELSKMPLGERQKVTGLEPKRADVIVAGGLVAMAVLDCLGATEARVSDRGVRWGLATALLGDAERA